MWSVPRPPLVDLDARHQVCGPGLVHRHACPPVRHFLEALVLQLGHGRLGRAFGVSDPVHPGRILDQLGPGHVQVRVQGVLSRQIAVLRNRVVASYFPQLRTVSTIYDSQSRLVANFH